MNIREERIRLRLLEMLAEKKINNFIVRNVVYHLDFDITVINKQYIFKNKEDDQKAMVLYKFAINPTNDEIDFVWPASVTVVRENNYTYSIQGVHAKEQDFDPEIAIDCSQHWSITFDNYDSNTNIHLFGVVAEPEGRNIALA